MRSPWRPHPAETARTGTASVGTASAGPARFVRLAVRTFSEVCLTAGTLIVLFVAYVLLWTGVKADQAMAGERDRLRDRWAAAAAGPLPGAPQPPQPHQAPQGSQTPRTPAAPPSPPTAPSYAPGEPFAEMRIPRFGRDWVKPVLEGTGTELLKKGLGHYPRTAALGGTGNFAVAGHRRTYGDPFKDFPELRPGDAVVLEDGTTRYTYTIRNKPLRTLPADVAVVDPVPRRSPFTAPGRYLTLTTCDPEWGHSHRLVVWAELTDARPVRRPSP
ncbi:class E sortase [Streptomyces sp. NPDC048603]|uniref:class E sortase n=1 Tax=Streptomyces sp. NPDC048603 TaxID=3365577 RepID=UPI0037246978